MKTIKYILDQKGYDVWSTTPDTLVYDALKMMAEKKVGALVVLEDDKLVGIFSERDYARKIILKGKFSKETPVRDVMTYNVIFTSPEQTIERGLDMMSSKRIRHLPVLDENELVGIVSIGDLVNAIIAQQKELIQQLEKYILEYTSIT
jgi:CBS domain-containing protein